MDGFLKIAAGLGGSEPAAQNGKVLYCTDTRLVSQEIIRLGPRALVIYYSAKQGKYMAHVAILGSRGGASWMDYLPSPNPSMSRKQ